ncbi:MAG: hypothetical protein QM817_04905 [Archangium sp.]
MNSLRVLSVCFATLIAGCSCREQNKTETPRAPDEVKPAFDGAPKALDANATALCAALHRVPAERRATCCQAGVPAHFESECARVVSLAVEAKTITLNDISACTAALEAAHQGCGWVGPNGVEVPPACDGVISGHVAQGQRCRSSLECVDGLRCRGAGPTSVGVCDVPGAVGVACEFSVDVLASYTRARSKRGSECSGFCQRHRCEAILTDGGACTLDAQCPSGQRCAGSCVPGERGGVGDACVPGGCVEGLRCVRGSCAAPLSDGASCSSDVECQGACIAADGGRVCARGC